MYTKFLKSLLAPVLSELSIHAFTSQQNKKEPSKKFLKKRSKTMMHFNKRSKYYNNWTILIF